MKKHKAITIPKISADALAKRLRAANPKVGHDDPALRIAEHLVKELSNVGVGDVNEELFNIKQIRKNERYWTQVRNILQNQKGYTAIELLILVALLATACVGAAGLYTLVHFIGKLW